MRGGVRVRVRVRSRGPVLLGAARLLVEQQQLLELVDVPVDLAVEDERDQQRLDLGGGDVELGGDEADADARVRLDHLEEHLRAYVLEEVLDVQLDEGVA